MNFIEQHQKGMETLGFWTEEYRSTTITVLEMQYKNEIIKEYYIEDFVPNGNKTLIKWKKRFKPLDKEQLKKKYGR
jgi:hypothetical protein